MSETTTIKLADDGPIRVRTRRVNVARGDLRTLDASVAEALCDEYDYFHEVCGVDTESGVCDRDPVECQYHGKGRTTDYTPDDPDSPEYDSSASEGDE